MNRKQGQTSVARGNHLKGYAGLVVYTDADGKEREVVPPCEHKHTTTHAARTCAAMRITGK